MEGRGEGDRVKMGELLAVMLEFLQPKIWCGTQNELFKSEQAFL